MKIKQLYYLIPIILIAAGFYIRLTDLSKWPLAVDEFYIWKSVMNIGIHGIPEFKWGGLYLRGIIFQYLSFISNLFINKPEYSLRLVSVISNLGTVVVLWRICVKFFDIKLFYIVSFLFIFSVWETEFSRFARMYTLFQFFTVLTFYFWLSYLKVKKEKSLYIAILISFISVFVHELGLFLIATNLFVIGFIDKDLKINNTFRIKDFITLKFITTIILFLIGIWWVKNDFRNIGDLSNFSNEYLAASNNIKRNLVRLPFYFSNNNYYLITALSLIFLANINLFRKTNYSLSYVIISTIFLLSSFGLIGLTTFALVVIYLLVDTETFTRVLFKEKLLKRTIINLSLSLFFTILITASFSPAKIKIIVKSLINYPNFYELFNLFFETIPVTTVFYVTLMFLSLVLIKKSKYELHLRALVVLLLILTLLTLFLNTKYFDTRYFFFLYPIIILVSSFVIIEISNKRTYLLLPIIVIVIFSEDYNWKHLLNISTPQVNYRVEMNIKLKKHYYPRWNTKVLAETINNNIDKNDLVITNEQTSSAYLKKLDYIYRDMKSSDFKGESVNHGKNERWTDACLISNTMHLDSLIFKTTGRKWLIINYMWGKKELEKSGLIEKLKGYQFKKSNDSTSCLYLINKVSR